VSPATISPPEPRLTPSEVVGRAEAMRPMLLEQQAETEERTYYSQETHQAFLDAGFYRLLQPRRYGGYEFDVPTYYRVVMAVSRGCPSTGWCLALASAHVLQVAALFSVQAQTEAFGDDGDFRAPLRALPHGSARQVAGGYLIDGTWDYCSGAPYATHFVGVTLLEPEGAQAAPQPVVFMLPRRQWRMLDDWGDIIGFRGSGSHSIAVDQQLAGPDLVVPVLLHDIDVSEGTPGLRLHGNPMYAGRYLAFFGAELASIIVGTARAALDEYERLARLKRTTFPPAVPRYLHPDFQRPLGVALGLIDTAEAAVLHVGERYMEYCRRGAQGGEPFSREEDLRLHAVASHAGRLAWEAVDLLGRKAGSSASARDGQRMQRYLRDLATYRSHHESTQFEAHATMLGRVRFGLSMWEDA
jgi:3-hydroxy-9,10-secoandrosta-1,3,5(10)-triene-9,17-dione monooxygenase